MSDLAALLLLAQKKNNYEKDATGATALWPAVTQYKATVPVAKRWFVFGGIVNRDASEAVSIYLRDASDDPIQFVTTASAATGIISWPSMSAASTVTQMPWLYVLDEGEYVDVTFGGNQGANAYASCVVLEIDI